MATLTIDSLLNCNFIPDFIDSGNRMIFNNTAAPTSWTKDTTSHNNKALRVTTGTAAPGPTAPGSLTFSQVFPATNKPVGGTISPVASAGVAVNQFAVGSLSSGLINVITQSPISIQNRTLAISQIVSHGHSVQRFPDADSIGCQATTPGPPVTGRNLGTLSTGNPNGPIGHGHGLPGGSQHSHTVTSTQHQHPITNVGAHTHPFTTTAQDFDILYADVIICIKN